MEDILKKSAEEVAVVIREEDAESQHLENVRRDQEAEEKIKDEFKFDPKRQK